MHDCVFLKFEEMMNVLIAHVTHFFTAEFHRVHAEFRGVFKGHLRCGEATEVAFAEVWVFTFYQVHWLDLQQDLSGAQTPATAGGKLSKTKKLRETLRVLCETLR
jgi:hypothetical protein